MSSNINTRDYWDHRFASGDWEQCGGRRQTTWFAEEQVLMLRLPSSFAGSLLDFGCGLGDALAVYRKRFPSATLIGIDHSEAAVASCREKYSHIADFIAGPCNSIPEVGVIVASAVLEHITDYRATVETLLSRCSELYVFVPYMEHPLCSEHVNRYDEDSFSSFETLETKVYCSRGWSEYGRALWVGVYLKNVLRLLLGRRLVHRRRMIMFRIKGRISSPRREVFPTRKELRLSKAPALSSANATLSSDGSSLVIGSEEGPLPTTHH